MAILALDMVLLDPDMIPDEPRRALRLLRRLWAVSVFGQLIVGGLLVWLVAPHFPATGRTTALYVAGGAFIVLAPLGYWARNECYKRYWQRHAVTPWGYVLGNGLLYALLEVVFAAALIGGIFFGPRWPCLTIAALALVTEAVNFPTGRPMQPHEPDVASRGDEF